MLNPDSIDKLQVECIDEDDGSMTICINWDETDPELKWWNDLGESGQKSFILDGLQQALDSDVN